MRHAEPALRLTCRAVIISSIQMRFSRCFVRRAGELGVFDADSVGTAHPTFASNATILTAVLNRWAWPTLLSGERIVPSAETPPAASRGSWYQFLRGRTTDFIAMAIIVAGGLTFGRQILHWWREPPPQPFTAGGADASSGARLGDGPVAIGFGSRSERVIRQVTRGSADEAWRQLVQLTVRHTREAAFPASEPTPSETTILDQMRDQTPVRADARDGWRVYRLHPELLQLVGLRDAEPGANSGRRTRLVVTGYLFPRPNGEWGQFVFLAAGASSEGADFPVPLPAGARKSLSVFSREHDGFVAFTGTDRLDEWSRHFRECFARVGWQPVDAWDNGENGRVLRFRSPMGAVPPVHVEVLLTQGSHLNITGMLSLSRTDGEIESAR